jgi:hypothetical protein
MGKMAVAGAAMTAVQPTAHKMPASIVPDIAEDAIVTRSCAIPKPVSC